MRLELTRRTDYAIRALVALASEAPDAPLLSAPRIASRASIPSRFLPHILNDLGRAGFVRAETGRSGGYRLARIADAISLYEVIEALEGHQLRRRCGLDDRLCDEANACALHPYWSAASASFRAILSHATIGQIARDSMDARRSGGDPIQPGSNVTSRPSRAPAFVTDAPVRRSPGGVE